MKERVEFKERVKSIEGAICKMAWRISTATDMEFDDAKQEMTISAWKSSQSYKKDEGTKFLTYAMNYMKLESKQILSTYLQQKEIITNTDYGFFEREDIPDKRVKFVENTLNQIVLNNIEKYLYEKKSRSHTDKRAHKLFVKLREGVKSIDCANMWSVTRCFINHIMKTKIKPLKVKFQ